MSLERIILSNLVFNDEYSRKVIPFIKEDYFQDQSEKTVFNLINDYVEKYNKFPSIEALAIDLSNKEGITEQIFKDSKDIIKSLAKDDSSEQQWLLDQTEKWCQDRAIYLGIMKSIKILDEKNGQLSKGSIPQILTDALAVSFDNNIGTDIFEDSDRLYEYIHNNPTRMPFGFEMFDKITKGGLLPKTLNVIVAGVGVGKTFALTNFAVQHLFLGKNVLYYTLEVSEEEIANRIYANILDVAIDDLQSLPKDVYDKKIAKAQAKTVGKLKIIEYPTSGASVANFRYSVNELQLKKDFIPDIIYVDYLNICASSKLKYGGSNVNSYSYIKSIAEELRAFAKEKNVPVFTATQLTRQGASNSDPGLEDTSECLATNTKVIKINGEHCRIDELVPGDRILGSNGFSSVVMVHHKKRKKMYKIKTASGKEIICSADHSFPTNEGRICINSGLKIGSILKTL